MFKLWDYLSDEEKAALNQLRQKLGGKVVYIPYPEHNDFHEYIEHRNQRIKKMFARLKKLGLSERVIYAEISIRLSCAKGLSQSHIRKIVKGYTRGKSKSA
ncbi:MAG: hypothetical protein ACE14V_03815 [bacterium]